MEATKGRISEAAFVASSSVFLALCLITVVCRCYIRFYIQREFGWEDVFFIISLCCLVVGFSLLPAIVDTLYKSQTFIFDAGIATINSTTDLPNIVHRISHQRTIMNISLTPMWISIACVKFCFLVFFKKLIRQMHTMNIYWWIIVVINTIVTIYGFAVATYYSICSFVPKGVSQPTKCPQMNRLGLALGLGNTQMALDIIGDALILVIPAILIWRIRTTWSQKIVLSLTLCLTSVMLVIAIARMAGIQWRRSLDSIWATYFFVIEAEIGLVLVSVSAFRTLYVSKTKDRRVNGTINSFGWYNRGESAVWRAVTKTTGNTPAEHLKVNKTREDLFNGENPHGTMTSMRTPIDANGKTRACDTMDEERADSGGT